MGDISPAPGVQSSDLVDRFRTLQANPGATEDDMFNNMLGVKAVFVTATAIPLATLIATYPANAVNVGKYARVSDVFGSVNTVMVCEYDTLGGYYWRPQRTDFTQSLTIGAGALTLTPLLTAPVLSLVGTITGSINVTPSTQYAWPGASFTITVRGVIPALTTVTLSGLVGGGTLPLLQGSTKVVRYTPASGWQGD